MSQLSHLGNYDVNSHGMDVSSLNNEGYQGQPNESHSFSNIPGGDPLAYTIKDALVLSKTGYGNETQYPATEIENDLIGLSTMNQSMTDLSSQTPNDDSLEGYPRRPQQDSCFPTPMYSLQPPTNPSAIAEMPYSHVEQKIQNPSGASKRKSSAVWTGVEVRPGEGRWALALLIKYKPNPTIEEIISISHDTGCTLESVFRSYCQNKSLGPGLSGEQILDSTKDSAYCLNQEREALAQPILKRARIRNDTNLHVSQTVADDSCPKEFQCDSCEKGFSRQSELRRHEQIHRPGELVCPKPGCDKCFKRKDHMTNHIKRIHGDLSSSAPQMPVLGKRKCRE